MYIISNLKKKNKNEKGRNILFIIFITETKMNFPDYILKCADMSTKFS